MKISGVDSSFCRCRTGGSRLLEEIKVCLQKQPERLQETRAIQKKIRQEKRSQLGAGP
ncbi:hypothetical protein EI42_04357 [Thermosporothrix hazakensis]|uniref:Uncharacterized protein n=1 Tax=Thermosporothrix hazakensis TaxID=644383 RepID=A0A326UEU3_THEHA|nr:hypothetical protein EI42_04357 [Thermosporothrix hazakensis]